MNILLSGHRRSGTHLLTDMLVNNFGYARASVDVDCLKNCTPRDKETFLIESKKDNIIFWTHSNSYDEITDFDDEFSSYVKEMIHKMKLIYIVRDGRDVMVSYAHMKKEPNFKTFMSYSLDNWIKNVTYWSNIINDDMIKYEDIIENYDIVIDKLSTILNMPKNCSPKDVRLKNLNTINPELKYSFREFRNGRTGDYKSEMSQDEISYFNTRCENIIKELKYVL